MRIRLNGTNAELPEGSSIIRLLTLKNLNPRNVVVEVNLQIIDRLEYDQTVLMEDDTVEIVSFVGGGCQLFRPICSRPERQ